MKKVHIFTSAAFNYIPKVRMLFNSLKEHHPEFVLHLALPDELHPDIDISSEPFDEIIPISTLNIPHWHSWSFCHNVFELATAIKPFVLQRLLEREDCEKVMYLDPDMVVFSRLDDILEFLEQCNIVLTPHQTQPETELEAIIDNEICSLKHGIYNLGFVGVSPTAEGMRFAQWWGQRLYHFCRGHIPSGLWTDQRWIDLVPAFFEGVGIIKTSRHNVAPWNISKRKLTGDMKSGYIVDGEPLGFYHFTGFDCGDHRIMAEKYADDDSSVLDLVNWYFAETKDLSQDPLSQIPWAFGEFSNGERIQETQRLIYRERVDLQAAYPDPYDASGFLEWWNSQGSIEYPDLFDEISVDSEVAKLNAILTPGFRAGKQKFRWDTLSAIFKLAVKDPNKRSQIIGRGIEILQTEGITGIKRRLKR